MEPQSNIGPNRSMNLIKEGINGHSRTSEQWKQIGDAEKKVVVNSEIKRMKELPGNSTYATHRLRVLNKALQLMSSRVGADLFTRNSCPSLIIYFKIVYCKNITSINL